LSFFRDRRTKARSERWEREDASTRLHDVVPALQRLRVELREMRDGAVIPGSVLLRHFIVDRAGTRFEFACGDSRCEGGGFDVSSAMMLGLHRRETSFEGDCGCDGSVGTAPCGRVLAFVAHAEYDSASVAGGD
jgi:hypothetical protein